MKPVRWMALRLVTALLWWAANAWAVPQGAPPALDPQADLTALQTWVWRCVDYGFEAPQLADAQLRQAMGKLPAGVDEASARRILLRARAEIAIASGDTPLARELTTEFKRLAGDLSRPSLARAELAFLDAVALRQSLKLSDAQLSALNALQELKKLCVGDLARLCDQRLIWRVQQDAGSASMRLGQMVEAHSLLNEAYEASVRMRDPALQVISAVALHILAKRQGDALAAKAWIERADETARASRDAMAMIRTRQNQAEYWTWMGDDAAAQLALNEALSLARKMGWERREAQMAIERSDHLLKMRQPAEALAVVKAALPVIQRFQDTFYLAPLTHNAGLAKLGLGRVAEGRQDLEAALKLWRDGSAFGSMLVALREHADALAGRGEYSAALNLQHKEEALRDEILQANREVSLRELRKRYKAQSEQQELSLLERENSVKAAKLENQRLQQRLWALAAGVLFAGLAVLALLLKRTQDTNMRLRRSEALLKVQSERDALTNLANRRHFRDVLASEAAGVQGFQGGLLLLDVDHFKRINDEFGHAAGDAVLVTLAQRLQAAVRSGDLVCRWGGEEFLVYIPSLGAEGMEVQARRLLASIGNEAVDLPDGRSLLVTASLGYGRFPLPRQRVPLSWEQAVNLVDMAMYSAKGKGRDCAAGLIALDVQDVPQLQAVEADFEDALNAGKVMLSVQVRPQ